MQDIGLTPILHHHLYYISVVGGWAEDHVLEVFFDRGLYVADYVLVLLVVAHGFTGHLPDLRQPRRPEDDQRDDEYNDDLSRSQSEHVKPRSPNVYEADDTTVPVGRIGDVAHLG